MHGKDYRKMLVELVKAAGQEVIDRAEDLVGNGDLITDFDIWLRFPQDGIPVVEVTKSHAIKRAYPILFGGTKNEADHL